jgi:hypothetical protein
LIVLGNKSLYSELLIALKIILLDILRISLNARFLDSLNILHISLGSCFLNSIDILHISRGARFLDNGLDMLRISLGVRFPMTSTSCTSPLAPAFSS